MLIDWFTVGAQIVNFLILLVALKIVLFDRIVAAMDRREADIAARITDAHERTADAEREAESYRSRRRELEQQRQRRLEEAELEATSRKSELLEQARLHVEELRTGWEAALDRDRRHLLDEARRRTAEQIGIVSRRALADLADAELEREVVRVALRRLEESAGEYASLAGACGDGSMVEVRTAFDLTGQLVDEIRHAVAAVLDCAVGQIAWARDPELICGLEIQSGGWTLGWNVDSYLDSLAEELESLLPPASDHEAGHDR